MQCMTPFHILMLTVGHDNTPRCMCICCVWDCFAFWLLTVDYDSQSVCVCVCVCVCVWPAMKETIKLLSKKLSLIVNYCHGNHIVCLLRNLVSVEKNWIGHTTNFKLLLCISLWENKCVLLGLMAKQWKFEIWLFWPCTLFKHQIEVQKMLMVWF